MHILDFLDFCPEMFLENDPPRVNPGNASSGFSGFSLFDQKSGQAPQIQKIQDFFFWIFLDFSGFFGFSGFSGFFGFSGSFKFTAFIAVTTNKTQEKNPENNSGFSGFWVLAQNFFWTKIQKIQKMHFWIGPWGHFPEKCLDKHPENPECAVSGLALGRVIFPEIFSRTLPEELLQKNILE